MKPNDIKLSRQHWFSALPVSRLPERNHGVGHREFAMSDPDGEGGFFRREVGGQHERERSGNEAVGFHLQNRWIRLRVHDVVSYSMPMALVTRTAE